MAQNDFMQALSYGLFVLTTRQGDKDNGCVINTVIQATTQPNRVFFTVAKKNHTHDMLLESKHFALSVLSEQAQLPLYQRFGFQSGKEVDKFAGFEGHAQRADNGVLYVTQGVNAFLAGTVISTMDLGSHTLFLADVTQGGVLSPDPSATYAYYQAHVKPAPAAEGATVGKKRWVCKVCGYVYEGEALPADFICPWCKHPASDFEPLA